MKFVLYLIFSVGELFGVMAGTSSDRREMLPVGLAVLAGVALIFFITAVIFSRTRLNGKIAFALSIVATIVIIALFCAVCILVEYFKG